MERDDGALKSTLTSQDVCAIISAGAKAQLLKLKFKELEVEYKSFHIEQNILPSEAPLEQLKTEQTQVLDKEAVFTKHDKLALMAIEDPLQYEKLLMSGELEDELEPRGQEAND